MKKIIVFITVMLLIFIGAVVMNNKAKTHEELQSFSIAINTHTNAWQWGNTYYEETWYADLIRCDCASGEVSFLMSDENCFRLFYSNGFCYQVQCNNDKIFIIRSATQSLEKIDEVEIDFVPEQIIECKECILLKRQAQLFLVDFEMKTISLFATLDAGAAETVLHSNGVVFAYNSDDGICVYDFSKTTVVEDNYKCMGFLDNETMVLQKELPVNGFVMLCYADVYCEQKTHYRIYHADIFEADFSPDGKYMVYTSPVGDGIVKTYLLDLITHKKTEFDTLYGGQGDVIQWVESR